MMPIPDDLFADAKPSGAASGSALPDDLFGDAKGGKLIGWDHKSSDDDIIKALGYDPETIKKSKFYVKGMFKRSTMEPGGTASRLTSGPLFSALKGVLNVGAGVGQLATRLSPFTNDSDVAFMDMSKKFMDREYERSHTQLGNKKAEGVAKAALDTSEFVGEALPGIAVGGPGLQGAKILSKQGAKQLGKIALAGGAQALTMPVDMTPGSTNLDYLKKKAGQAEAGAAFAPAAALGIEGPMRIGKKLLGGAAKIGATKSTGEVMEELTSKLGGKSPGVALQDAADAKYNAAWDEFKNAMAPVDEAAGGVGMDYSGAAAKIRGILGIGQKRSPNPIPKERADVLRALLANLEEAGKDNSIVEGSGIALNKTIDLPKRIFDVSKEYKTVYDHAFNLGAKAPKYAKASNINYDELPDNVIDALSTGGARESIATHDAMLAGFRDGTFNRYGESIPKPVVAERIGRVPESGISWNHREQRAEPGLSVIGTYKNGELVKQSDGTYEIFNSGDRHSVHGFESSMRTGTDGEPMIMYATDLGKTSDLGIKRAESSVDNSFSGAIDVIKGLGRDARVLAQKHGDTEARATLNEVRDAILESMTNSDPMLAAKAKEARTIFAKKVAPLFDKSEGGQFLTQIRDTPTPADLLASGNQGSLARMRPDKAGIIARGSSADPMLYSYLDAAINQAYGKGTHGNPRAFATSLEKAMPAVEQIADPEMVEAFKGLTRVARTARFTGFLANMSLAAVPVAGPGLAPLAALNPAFSGPGIIWKALQSPNGRKLLKAAGKMEPDSKSMDLVTRNLIKLIGPTQAEKAKTPEETE